MSLKSASTGVILVVSLVVLAALLIAGWTYLGYHVVQAGVSICQSGMCH